MRRSALRLRFPWWPCSAWVLVFLAGGDIFGMEFGLAIRLVSLAVVIALSLYSARRRAQEGVPRSPGWTLLVAVALWMIAESLVRIYERHLHQGGGVVSYGDSDNWKDEIRFKRHHYGNAAIGIAFGAFCLWVMRVLLRQRHSDVHGKGE